MRNLFAALVLCGGLLGCNSLNFSTITYNRYDSSKDADDTPTPNPNSATPAAAPAEPPAADTAAGETDLFGSAAALFGSLPGKPPEPAPLVPPPTGKPASAGPVCPPYAPVRLEAIPALPYRELEAAGTDPAKIDALERRHIEELRRYILRNRIRVHESQTRYLAACKAFIESQSR